MRKVVVISVLYLISRLVAIFLCNLTSRLLWWASMPPHTVKFVISSSNIQLDNQFGRRYEKNAQEISKGTGNKIIP
jgi:hypothetical protein